jgi:hypothetical protein
MAGWFLDIIVGHLIRTVIHLFKSRGSHQWPKQNATVLSSRMLGGYGGPVAEVIYSYTHQGRYCSGQYKKPFMSSDSAKRFVAGFPKRTQIVVRVKPEDPVMSIVRDDDQPRMTVNMKD